MAMTTIEKHDGGNIGGVLPVRFAFKEDITSITINASTLAATMLMKVEPGWNFLYATPDTIKVESDEEDLPAGMKYSYKITMMIPKDRATVEADLMQLNNRGMVIVAHDKNGIARLYGTIENPMRKLSKLNKPANLEEFNGWELVFYGEFS
jgi:hypothetical protein